ncbi:MAG: GrpB family protein [Bacillus subtilis]|nr:GrpB family protein [Bacillus subtilis]
MTDSKKEVIVVDYDPEWPRRFELLRSTLYPLLNNLVLAIEHVGSTSVPGLAAKPIIDLDVVIRRGDLALVEQCLFPYGYKNRGDLGLPERFAFAGPEFGFPYHLYIVYPDSIPYLEHIALRDALRTSDADRDAYAALKRRLATIHRYDIDSYIDGKTALIRQLLAKSKANQ